ncbi:MAG: DUF616 domain-containing protein [Alphaproteobacteria bacterium]|nr:DUF616 domain-containing protein [Alphaproteobacteria bacterium]
MPKPKAGVVYTCITNGYDNLIQHTYTNQDWDYVCFTDNTKLLQRNRVGIWQIRPLAFSASDHTKNARWHKTHPHVLFPEYQASLWIDSNGDILTPHIFDLATHKNQSLMIPYHFSRDCIFDEANAVVKYHKDSPENVNNVVYYLESNQMPRNYGLNETNIIFRRHHDPKIIHLMDSWWHHIENYSKRDQLSLSYVLWRAGIAVADISFPNARTDIQNFAFITHTSDVRRQRWKLFVKIRDSNGRRRIYCCGIRIFTYHRKCAF